MEGGNDNNKFNFKNAFKGLFKKNKKESTNYEFEEEDVPEQKGQYNEAEMSIEFKNRGN